METAAWWTAYFGGALVEERLWTIADGTSIGFVCAGEERRVVVVHGGERTVFGDRQPVVDWQALVTIADAADGYRSHVLAALHRFAWTPLAAVEDAKRQLRDAHGSIGAIDDVAAFVDRTFVTTNVFSRGMPPAIEHVVRAATHATPEAACAFEFDLGAAKLREARALPAGASEKAACYRAAVERFLAASEQPVAAVSRADALCYAGATLVELAGELPLDEALVTLELAASRLELVTRIDPTYLDGRRRAADAYHHMGDRLCDDDPARAARLYTQCAQHARELLAATPADEHPATLDILIGAEVMIEDCLRRAGDAADAKAALARAIEATERLAQPTMNSACAYAAAGRVDDALRVLEIAAPADGLTADDLRANDVFDVLHADPRWAALIARL